MSTQADQLIASIRAESGVEPAEIVDLTTTDAEGIDYSIVELDNSRPYYVRHRQVWRLSDGAMVAAEWNEGLGKHAWTDPRPEAYRVTSREVTTTEYVREEP